MKEITLKAALENIGSVMEFVDAELEMLDCPVKAQTQIDISVDEIFSNIARYAYEPDEGEATVRFAFSESDRVVSLTFIDCGIPYNPLEKEDPDVSLSIEEREVGGLGIFMVKKSMDEMDYHYQDGQNILTVRKKI